MLRQMLRRTTTTTTAATNTEQNMEKKREGETWIKSIAQPQYTKHTTIPFAYTMRTRRKKTSKKGEENWKNWKFLPNKQLKIPASRRMRRWNTTHTRNNQQYNIEYEVKHKVYGLIWRSGMLVVRLVRQRREEAETRMNDSRSIIHKRREET